ncbi:MAG: N-methyl-L-tryptophan oxidase [Actinomycetota bacterium]
MTTDADVVVVGAGVMGAATAWSLSRRGREVLVLERFEVGNTHGSSHGDSRVFRLFYDDPWYVRLGLEAVPLWRRIEEESGVRVLSLFGGLDLGARATANAKALEVCGVDFEVMDGAEVEHRFQGVAAPAGDPVVFQRDAGIVHAEAAVRAFLDAATSRGAEVRERTPVLELTPGDAQVELRTGGETIRARTAVVTAGAFARPLLATGGIDLPVTPTRATVAYFQKPGMDELWPPIMMEWVEPPFYALPSPMHGLKAAQHHAGPVTDPEEPGVVSEESVAKLSAWVAERFPAADPRPHLAETCLYTDTVDEGFILERHGSIVVGSPCSGHGFKFASAIGERLADLVPA